MPQIKPDGKLLNRAFALIFILYALICTYYVTVWDLGSEMLEVKIIMPMVCFLIIIAGLLVEAWKPSLDFKISSERKMIFLGAFLLAVFVLLNLWWWVANGIPQLLPNQGLQAAFMEYFSKVLACDTSILALMFGILFLTNSSPRKSLSYKIMLIGALVTEIQLFMGHILLAATGGMPGSQIYGNYWEFTIFQPWYWMDIISQIAVFAGVVLLLRKAMNIKKLILATVLFLILFIMLSGLLFLPNSPLP